MPDFQFNSFPINATPLADVSEANNSDSVLIVRNGSVQQVPKASAAHAVGALDSTDLEPYVQKTQTVNGNALSGNITVEAVDVPFTPTTDIESENVQDAITEAVGYLKVERETLLYTGSTTAVAAGNYTLSDDVSNYEYLEFWIGYNGRAGIQRIPVRDGISFSFRIPNISDSTSTLLYVSEIGFSVSGTVLTVSNVGAWQQGNGSTYNPTKTQTGAIYIEKILGIKYDFLAGSGGGGSSNYNDLSNKPSINSVTLSGNKSGADLGLIDAPSSPTTGQFLSWNGSAWVAASLPVYNGGVS